jgi:hypothetical protein
MSKAAKCENIKDSAATLPFHCFFLSLMFLIWVEIHYIIGWKSAFVVCLMRMREMRNFIFSITLRNGAEQRATPAASSSYFFRIASPRFFYQHSPAERNDNSFVIVSIKFSFSKAHFGAN